MVILLVFHKETGMASIDNGYCVSGSLSEIIDNIKEGIEDGFETSRIYKEWLGVDYLHSSNLPLVRDYINNLKKLGLVPRVLYITDMRDTDYLRKEEFLGLNSMENWREDRYTGASGTVRTLFNIDKREKFSYEPNRLHILVIDRFQEVAKELVSGKSYSRYVGPIPKDIRSNVAKKLRSYLSKEDSFIPAERNTYMPNHVILLGLPFSREDKYFLSDRFACNQITYHV